ncbi:MAG: hypothetical protein WCW31_05080 [Patescibacteria group bacterium]|jgi:hypothetical protein
MGLMLNLPRIKKIVLASVIAVSLCSLSLTSQALAAGAGSIRSGLDSAAQTSGLNQGAGTSLETVIGNLINAALSLVGVLLLVYLIYGGFKYMTAGGSGKGTEEAITIIKNAVVGLIIIVLSYYIADFVLTRLVGATEGGVVTPA